jgi:hypothetical protein
MRGILFFCLMCLPIMAHAQVVETAQQESFRKSVIKAAQSLQQKGELKRSEVVKLRVALLSPSFRQRAEDLAVIQMSASGEDVPVDENGLIQRANIDWDKLLAFLEKLIPIILQLITAFSYISPASWSFC